MVTSRQSPVWPGTCTVSPSTQPGSGDGGEPHFTDSERLDGSPSSSTAEPGLELRLPAEPSGCHEPRVPIRKVLNAPFKSLCGFVSNSGRVRSAVRHPRLRVALQWPPHQDPCLGRATRRSSGPESPSHVARTLPSLGPSPLHQGPRATRPPRRGVQLERHG